MVTALTIKCDWPGCKATLTIPCEHDAAEHRAWKQETYGLFSLHLCPEHRRHNWFQVRDAQFREGMKHAHTAGRSLPQ
jgi:hypothetical protein